MKTKNPLLIVCAAGALLLAGPALAHGQAEPLHGGVVQTAHDLSFELVALPGRGAALYVVDHDEPVDVSRYGGKLTVLAGQQKTEAELKPAGGNKLEAAGVQLPKGAKVVATVKTDGHQTLAVRFALQP